MALSRQLVGWTAWIAAVTVLIAALLFAAIGLWPFALGIAAGCVVALFSLAFLHKEVAKYISSGKSRAQSRRFTLTNVLKYAIIGVMIYTFLYIGQGNAAGFAFGVGLVYLALFAAAVWQARHTSSSKDN